VTTKIALVGDLSFGDPTRLAKVLDAALVAADHVVQLGDIAPAYSQVRSRWLTSGNQLHPLKGNHDIGQYEQIGCPATWSYQTTDGLVTLLGLDNSAGTLTPDSKTLFSVPKTTPFEFAFAHMPPVDMVLPSGDINKHNMAETGQPGSDDAAWLCAQLKQRSDMMGAGHYHGMTVQYAPFGPLIVDGRGGAAPDLAYTLITVTEDGWVLHSVGV
jgi:hypothetical protein